MRRRTFIVIFTALLLVVAFFISILMMNGIDFLQTKYDNNVNFDGQTMPDIETGFTHDNEGDNNVVYIPQLAIS